MTDAACDFRENVRLSQDDRKLYRGRADVATALLCFAGGFRGGTGQRSLPGTGFAWGTKASWPGRGMTLFSRWRVRALS